MRCCLTSVIPLPPSLPKTVYLSAFQCHSGNDGVGGGSGNNIILVMVMVVVVVTVEL